MNYFIAPTRGLGEMGWLRLVLLAKRKMAHFQKQLLYFVHILEKCIAVQKNRSTLVLLLMKMGKENTLKSQTSSVSICWQSEGRGWR